MRAANDAIRIIQSAFNCEQYLTRLHNPSTKWMRKTGRFTFFNGVAETLCVK
jgi:hypothetical protein